MAEASVVEEEKPKESSSAPPSFWFWGAEDRLFLGLGTMLYLNFLRFAALLFGLLFITALPNMANNAMGDRFSDATSASAFLTYVSQVSLSNLGFAVSILCGGGALYLVAPEGAQLCANAAITVFSRS